jgi:hypothetical protein
MDLEVWMQRLRRSLQRMKGVSCVAIEVWDLIIVLCKSNTMRRASRENRYAECESYDGMPADGIKLYSWQYNQLRNGSKGLNAKIWKETARNEGVPCVVIE